MNTKKKSIVISILIGILFISSFMYWGFLMGTMPGVGNEITINLSAWNSNTFLAGIRCENWVPIMIGIVMGILMLLVIFNKIRLNMIIPRIVLIVTILHITLFGYILLVNTEIGVGLITTWASLVGLFIMTFFVKKNTKEEFNNFKDSNAEQLKEEINEQLKEELRAEIKEELIAEIKAELKGEVEKEN